jgi:hypothetical protein
MRFIERLVIAGGGIFFGYLGYRLFLLGSGKGSAKFTTESKWFRMVFSGTAPGLFLMLCGCSILVVGLFVGAKGENSTYRSTTFDPLKGWGAVPMSHSDWTNHSGWAYGLAFTGGKGGYLDLK